MPPDARRAAWAAAGIAVAIAGFLGLLRAVYEPGLSTAQTAIDALGIVAMFGGPALVGAIGAATGQRSVVLAAGIGSGLFSLMAFSGVSLPLLVPAAVFLAAASRGEPGDGPDQRDAPSVARTGGALGTWTGVRPLLVALASVMTGFAGLLLFGTIGVLWFVGCAAIGPIVIGRATLRLRHDPAGTRSKAARRPTTSATRATGQHESAGMRRFVAEIATVALVEGLLIVAAFLALFTTETVCWEDRLSPDGVVRREVIPPPGETILGNGIQAAGCDGGELTAWGVTLEMTVIAGAGLVATFMPRLIRS